MTFNYVEVIETYDIVGLHIQSFFHSSVHGIVVSLTDVTQTLILLTCRYELGLGT